MSLIAVDADPGQLIEHEFMSTTVGSDQLLLRHRIPYDQADPTERGVGLNGTR